jgi:hypothetical protein
MRLAALLLLVAPLALAACGGGKKSSNAQSTLTPVAYVQSAATKTGQATSEHMSLSGSVTVNGQVVMLTGGGDFDNPAKKGAFHLDFSAGGLTGSIDEVLAGTTIYMKTPLIADALPKGKTWMKIDLTKAASAQGFNISSLGAQDPTQILAQLKTVGTVTEIGDEDVGGTATTHYRGNIDISKVPQGEQLKASTDAKYGPYDVWIGKDDGLVRRVKTSFSFAVQGAVREAIAMTSDFSDFGKDVSVSVPPEADTFDATDASIKGLGG